MNETEKAILETQQILVNQLLSLTERMITICQDVKSLLINELATEMCIQAKQGVIDELTKKLHEETREKTSCQQRKKLR
jgi:hypothetical protein